MMRLREREDQENKSASTSTSQKRRYTTSSPFTKERAQLQTVISKLRKENRQLEEKLEQTEMNVRTYGLGDVSVQ